jgi:hypothetical protein
MSDQGKSNFQAFGAGLLGFVAVMAIGGGAMMVHNSQQAKAAAKPVAAAAPIDLGSSMPRPSMSGAVALKERREESPAPLMGAEDESEGAQAAASAASASSPAGAAPAAATAAPNDSAEAAKSSVPALEATQHLDKPGGGSSATAVVKNTTGKLSKAGARKTAPKLDPTGGGSTAIASVHYGVTSRNELMGRAAGPVYNFQGGAAKGSSAGTGQLAGDVNAKIADLKKQLDAAGLPADQRAQLEKDLAGLTQGVNNAAKTAQ